MTLQSGHGTHSRFRTDPLRSYNFFAKTRIFLFFCVMRRDVSPSMHSLETNQFSVTLGLLPWQPLEDGLANLSSG